MRGIKSTRLPPQMIRRKEREPSSSPRVRKKQIYQKRRQNTMPSLAGLGGLYFKCFETAWK